MEPKTNETRNPTTPATTQATAPVAEMAINLPIVIMIPLLAGTY